MFGGSKENDALVVRLCFVTSQGLATMETRTSINIISVAENFSLGQFFPFGGSTGARRQCLGAPDLVEQKYNGLGKYELSSPSTLSGKPGRTGTRASVVVDGASSGESSFSAVTILDSNCPMTLSKASSAVIN